MTLKIKNISILVLFLLLKLNPFFAQSIEIQDTIFRNYLKNKLPQLLDANNKLDTNKAKIYTGDISCGELGITNLDELQYFYSINLLNCANNKITSLPKLTKLTKLVQFWVFGNQLTSIPNINQNLNLEVFNVKDNHLATLPSLQGLYKLKELDCSTNRLTYLPDLSDLQALDKLYCYSNQLTSIPSLTKQINLSILDLQNNKLTQIPDLLNCVSLKKVLCNENELTQIPSFMTLTKLTDVGLKNNRLTFEDLLPHVAYPNFNSVFTFTPQKSILIDSAIQLVEGATWTFDAKVDKSVSSNTYQWYNLDSLYFTSTTSVFEVAQVSTLFQGDWKCIVKNNNSALSNLELTIFFKTVNVSSCIAVKGLDFQIESNNCINGATIKLDKSEVSGLNIPLVYQLLDYAGTSQYKEINDRISNVSPGNYQLKISDKNNCSISISNLITVPSPFNCTLSFTPNGDGIEDTFTINIVGAFSIYNKGGQLVQKMSGPNVWDGRDFGGNLVPLGVYIVLQEGKQSIELVVLD